jgi:hypothetical protein
MKMNKNYTNKNFLDYFNYLKINKIPILFSLFLSLLASILISSVIQDKYKSFTIVSPVNEESGMNSMLQSYGSIASLAGIDIDDANIDIADEALEVLKSFHFFKVNVLPNINKANLMALSSWNQENNTIIYNKKLYNSSKKEWQKNSKFKSNKEPSDQEAYKEFKKTVSVITDKETNFITISISHASPYIAKKWLDILIREVNLVFRMSEKKEVSSSIQYIDTQLQINKNVNIDKTFNSILEKEMQKLILIEIRDEYVFKTLEPPIVSENNFSPNKPMIIIFLTLLGFFTSVIYFIVKYKFKSILDNLK